MYVFHIHYRNTQGTLMRILNAASRRGIDMPYVQAEPVEQTHQVTLLLSVNAKQIGQLCREWSGIVDVLEVRTGIAINDLWSREAISSQAGPRHLPVPVLSHSGQPQAATA